MKQCDNMITIPKDTFIVLEDGSISINDDNMTLTVSELITRITAAELILENKKNVINNLKDLVYKHLI